MNYKEDKTTGEMDDYKEIHHFKVNTMVAKDLFIAG